MTKTIAIVQSNYIPWRGYFDMIAGVDEFVLYDDVQYTRRDWRNRNRVKTPHGLAWLTIPVEVRGRFNQKICETRTGDPHWAERHWRTLSTCYSKAPYFIQYREVFERLYLSSDESYLSRINRSFLDAICGLLGIQTQLRWSTDFDVVEGRTERLVSICQQAGATRYLSGPTARGYIDQGLFERAGIEIAWMDYEGYPEYPQLQLPFESKVSIVDLLFNVGPDASGFLKYTKGRRP